MLHIINTSKFKTITTCICYRIETTKYNLASIGMLRRLLMLSTSDYKTKRELNIKSMELYRLYSTISAGQSGKYLLFKLNATFINEKYTEKGMNKKCFDYLLDFIRKPNITNNEFNKEDFEVVKKQYIETLEGYKDDPNTYSEERLIEEMDKEKLYGYMAPEIIDELKNITPSSLYDFFLNLKKQKLDVFICGDVKKEKIEQYFKDFEFNDEKLNHIITHKEYRKETKKVIENMNINQSKLFIGLKFKDITDKEFKYISRIYSNILGGGINSLLSLSVREKNSMCYYIYTSLMPVNNIILIGSGIDGKNFDKVLDLINIEMEKIKNGDFDNKLIEYAKYFYKNALIEVEDSQNSIINNAISINFLGNDDNETKLKMIDTITKKEVVNFSKKVKVDTIYLLKGDK